MSDGGDSMEVDDVLSPHDQANTGDEANSRPSSHHSSPAANPVTLSFKSQYPLTTESELVECASYDIVPTIALIHGTPIYSLTASWGMRYLFTGGEDGLIRMYDFADTIAGKQLLTIGQRHMMPDSITKGGVLVSYWENEQPLFEGEYTVAADSTYQPKLSPAYSLAVQSEALWLCSGLESGGISLQTVRCGAAEPGLCQAYLDGHHNAVSDLKLSGSETQLLSGSWDKSIILWDLETGGKLMKYEGLHGQISCVEYQPLGGLPALAPALSGSIASNTNGTGNDGNSPDAEEDDKSMGSLFGSDDDEAPKDSVDKDSTNNKDQEETSEHNEAEPSTKNDIPDDLTRNTGNVFMSASYNGKIDIWDCREPAKVAFSGSSEAPPWCMSACWSWDGNKIYASRRNSTVEEYDIRRLERPSRILKFPAISGAVTNVLALPNGHSLLCGSNDNIRLYDLNSQRKTPFYIVPGHHGAVVSRMLLDQSGRYLFTASGGRGWHDSSSEVVLGYEVNAEGITSDKATSEIPSSI